MAERAHIYILRLEHLHLKEWAAKAKEGDETAKLVLSHARKALSHLRTEPWGCACCDREFLADDDVPKAFIVLIPPGDDPEKVKTSMGMVCRECSARDDQWGTTRRRWPLIIGPAKNGPARAVTAFTSFSFLRFPPDSC